MLVDAKTMEEISIFNPETCGGHVADERFLTAAPSGGLTLDVNGDANLDTLTDEGLFVNCGDGRRLHAVRSTGPLVATVDPRGGPWLVLAPAGGAATTVWTQAGQFRLSMPTFWPAPPPPLRFKNGRYTAELPLCAALDVHAPLVTPAIEDGEASALTVADAEGGLTIAADDLEIAVLGPATWIDADADAAPDLLLAFYDRYGSGRESYAALLLGCGDGAFLNAGEMAADEGSLEPISGGFLGTRTWLSRETLEASQVLWVGWRLDLATWGLVEVDPAATRAEVVKRLQSAR
jgi:hypothetical protein